MLDNIYWLYRNNVGRHFSKLFCRLWGHPVGYDEFEMVMMGVTVLKGCMACGAKTFELAPCDLKAHPDYDPTPCDCTEEEAKAAYPNHHPTTALANYQAGREVWDTNGDLW